MVVRVNDGEARFGDQRGFGDEGGAGAEVGEKHGEREMTNEE
jgi:hypothetical protein